MANEPVTVLIVSGSAALRQFLAQVLSEAPGIEVVGSSGDSDGALEQARLWRPQVLIVDHEPPRIDCAAVVRHATATLATAVVICAERTVGNAVPAAGAAAVIERPRLGADGVVEGAVGQLVHAVRRAARTLPQRAAAANGSAKLSADAILAAVPGLLPAGGREPIVAIGTSTGGTQALETILPRLPADCRGIVIVQHMPAVFTAMFAERLHAVSQIEVREARDGERVRSGLALVAPGGKHMLLKRQATHFVVEVIDGPPVNRHRPSVDVLFRSVARYAGANAMGIIMTGMGDDGARGLKEMHDAGAQTIAQDEASCVVFGMPKEAIKLGAVDRTLPLCEIAAAIANYSQESP